MENNRDKHKDNGILLEHSHLLKLSKEAMRMAENNPELLNAVYKEISEKLGMDRQHGMGSGKACDCGFWRPGRREVDFGVWKNPSLHRFTRRFG